jgi:hypothetical protein
MKILMFFYLQFSENNKSYKNSYFLNIITLSYIFFYINHYQLYKSSSISIFLDPWLPPLLGQFIFGPDWGFDLFTNVGSNFLLNCSNFSKSTAVTDFLAVLNDYSKCFLVIYGTGSNVVAFPPFCINAFILASASMDFYKIFIYISDSCFGGFLAYLCQIGTWKSLCNLS